MEQNSCQPQVITMIMGVVIAEIMVLMLMASVFNLLVHYSDFCMQHSNDKKRSKIQFELTKSNFWVQDRSEIQIRM